MIMSDLLETKIVNASTLCRACLTHFDNMKNMLSEEEYATGLLAKFVSVVCIEDINDCTANICSLCEQKLIMSYDFQQKCRKSNEILEQYLVKTKTLVDEKDTISLLPVSEDDNEDSCMSNNQLDVSSDDADKDTDELQETQNLEGKQSRQLTRLAQYTQEEVTEAIEECRRLFLENVNCIKCGFVGSNSRSLSIHMTHLHKDLKGRWCAQCNLEVENLDNHSKLHKNDVLCCRFCNKSFQSRGHFTEHLLSHSVDRPYKCEICEKSFISKRHLTVHERIHSGEKPYKCSLCFLSFKQRAALKNHLKVHKKGSYRCSLCFVLFSKLNVLRSHLKDHENAKNKYNCTVCQLTFIHEKTFKEHQCANSTQSDDTKYDQIEENLSKTRQNFCNECNKNVRSLKVHIEKIHSNCPSSNSVTSNNKLCTACGKQFKSLARLKVHMRIHTGETPYKCSYCDKRVCTRNRLVVHERVHTGEKPHICTVCGKAFSQSSCLNTHMKIHTGRPEACLICDQRFCRPAELKLHMRKHTGEKPYICVDCGHSFIQRSHLMEHIKIHSDERPYQCTYCEKAFKQSSSLKSHIQIHLGYKPFKCSQCSYACRQSYSLTQHMKTHTNDTPRMDKPYICDICNKNFNTVAMLNSHSESAHTLMNNLIM